MTQLKLHFPACSVDECVYHVTSVWITGYEIGRTLGLALRGKECSPPHLFPPSYVAYTKIDQLKNSSGALERNLFWALQRLPQVCA